MDYKKHTIDFNNILNELSVYGFIYNKSLGPPYSISLDGYSIFIQNQSALKKFHDTIEKFYIECTKVSDLVSFKTTRKYFEKALLIVVKDKKLFEKEMLLEIVDDILSMETNNYKFFYEINGINLGYKNSVIIGEYEFIKPTTDHEYFNLNDNPNETVRKIINSRDYSNITLVSVNVLAKDINKASELADEKINSLEHIFNFIIADINHQYSIGVFNNWGFKPIVKFVQSENRGLGIIGNSHIVHDFNFDDIDLGSKEFGYNKVWELFTRNSLTPIQKRIINAIKWYGKGINDYDLNQSFIHFIFAIESILNHNEQSEIITAGISHKISEAIAFIVSVDKTDRKPYFKEFKRLYTLRSGIAHGSKQNIKRDDVLGVMFFSKRLIANLLVSDIYSKFKTISELYDYIEELKFS